MKHLPSMPRTRYLATAAAITVTAVGIPASQAFNSSASATTSVAVQPLKGRSATLVGNLPRIPWEGGSAYWGKFANARAGGWNSASFFPIGCWFCNVSSDAEVAFDKSRGINTYIGMWEGTDFSLFTENRVYWLGTGLKGQSNKSPYNPGVLLDDEADGTFTTPSAGQQHLAALRNTVGSNRFSYANFTSQVIGSDMALSDQLKFVNNYTDAVSVDMYWYSIPFCNWTPYRGGLYAVPIPQKTCRTAHSYGLTNEALRKRDAADGKLQPTWTWVENFNGMSGDPAAPYITPAQLKAAAMSTIIHEARGLFWFNQSFTGSCQSANVIREAQYDPNSTCGKKYRANINAMGVVNNQVKALAPVLNTQSYKWNFGTGIDSMLKLRGGYAYIFAMTDGTAGKRTFTLPGGVLGKTVQVLNENRSLRATNAKFTDTFAAETSYHIYRISLK